MVRDLLKEQDLRTSTPQRWRKEQFSASTMLVCPRPLALGRWAAVGKTLGYASQAAVY